LQPDLHLHTPALLLTAVLILASSAFATKETVILPFDITDGATPLSGFVADKHGNLYGVTSIGGTGDCSDYGGGGGCGTVYKLSPPAKNGGAWTETVLYNFQGGADGDEVVGRLIFDKNGNLYGTTALGGGGTCTYGCGTVFELSPPAQKGGVWTKSIIYSFQGGTTDGSYPEAALVFDNLGNLYGTTFYGGGPNCAGYGCGTVFELSPPQQRGDAWTETVLHTFIGPTSADGYGPSCNLIFDAAGNLYGTTGFGGTYNNGAVFEMSPPAVKGDPWTESVIYSFIGPPDGASPDAGLTAGPNGAFYGSASTWGPETYGTIFELKPPRKPGGAWTETVLHAFTLQADGGIPSGGVIPDEKGNLYGTTAVGGDYSCNAGFNDGCGVVFKLARPAKRAGAWKETVLHSFTGGQDGIQPESGLLFGKFGLLYGTTENGGASDAGTVFSVAK
jgi:uncharacterized repeat protein (TIGR03803 family)